MTENLIVDGQKPLSAAGIDIFYGMLTSPIQTFNMLSSPIPASLSSLLNAVLIVVVAALAESSATSHFSALTSSGIALNIIGSFLGKIFFWSALAIFLRLLAALFRQPTSVSTCYTVTGWAFLPLIFRAIASCFSNATAYGDIITLILSIWFLLLQLFAFDSVLKLGRFKTLGIILILPPCLFLAYFLSMLFAGAVISHGLF